MSSMAVEIGYGGPAVDNIVTIGSEDEGISLTWEDLWVIASNGNSGSQVILSGLAGYAQPGEVLAVMGPSGCGRLGSNMNQSGNILINGRRQPLAFGTSAYVAQDDILMTTLTIREALHYSAQLQLPNCMTKSEKLGRAEMVMREMGLEDAKDTRIGGRVSKGTSGGQKRRLSICLEILSHPKLLFLDEPTSGLDSAASFHVMNRIVKLARQDGLTIIASIHQPASEVFELFDSLCLLASGKVVYFGSVSMASEFFALNGFPCPSFRNPSDHYLRTINKDFDKEVDGSSSSNQVSITEATAILTESYMASDMRQAVTRRVLEIREKNGSLVRKRSQASFATQCFVLTKRSFVNMYRDPGYYWLRLAIYTLLCLSIGTVFYNVGQSFDSIRARSSAIVFVTGYLTFMTIGGFPSFVEDIKVFHRERLSGHYGATAFMISQAFSSAPYLALISIIPAVIAYYLVGFDGGFDHFLFFVLVVYMCMLLIEGLMMVVACLVPDYLMGIITGAGIQGLLLLDGGFFQLPHDLPEPVWRFPVHYIGFHKYANQALYKNEFIGKSFPNNLGGNTTGGEIVKDYWQMDGYSKWLDLAVLFGMVVVYRLLFLVCIKVTEKVKPLVGKVKALSMNKSIQILNSPLNFRN
ncbi:ABC transporter G family member 1-like isoform X2 [Typha latifolia]|uniref:ABC transporter G family member 1-like isoform X2 n=1 Tax=Typha latifolia TaxID=4733 RepID=UPI003C2E4AEE